MLATHFKLPATKLCVVVWYRNHKKNEQLLPTPPNNKRLVEQMFSAFLVGASEIRAVKPVDPQTLILNNLHPNSK